MISNFDKSNAILVFWSSSEIFLRIYYRIVICRFIFSRFLDETTCLEVNTLAKHNSGNHTLVIKHVCVYVYACVCVCMRLSVCLYARTCALNRPKEYYPNP